MQTDANNFIVIAKPKNESDSWKIEQCSLCCDAVSDPFLFDAAIQPSADHASFYKEAIEDRVSQFIHGYNVTIVTYGAANAGKTHTIVGTAGQTRLKSEARGVIVRAVTQLFDYVHSKENSNKVFHVSASFYHIFDDGRVADLLDTQKRNVDLIGGDAQPYYAADVTKQTINSVEEVVSLVERGSLMRNASGCVRNKKQQQPSLLKQQPLLQAYKAHLSHAFFCLSLEQKEQQSAKISQLRIVDLAGHNVDKLHAENCEDPGIDDLYKLMTTYSVAPIQEASSLGKLLGQSFGGNTLSVLICNVNLDDSELSIKCLSTAQSMVSKVTNKAVVNEVPECKVNLFLNEANDLKASVAKKCGIEGDVESWNHEDNGQLTINGIVVSELSESCQSIVKKVKEIEKQLIRGGSKKPSTIIATPMQLPTRVPMLSMKSKLPALAAPPGVLRPLPLPLQVVNKRTQDKADHLSVAAATTTISISNAGSTDSIAVSDSDSDEEVAPALPPAGTLPALSGIPHVVPDRLPPTVQTVPLIVTPAPSTEEAKPPTHPVIHVQPQPSEMAYDTSSIQALPSLPPSPTEVDSIKTPSLSDSDDGSVIVSPLTTSPSPPSIAAMPTLHRGFSPSQQSDNAILLPQSHSLVPLVLPPSRQTLAPLNLPGNLPQQPLHVAAQSLDTSMSSEVTQDNSELASPRPTLAQPILPPIGSLPRYDQVHGNASSRGRPQLPSYTASPTPEPPTSPNLEEDQSRVTSLEEIHIAAMDGVKSSTMKKLALRYGVDYRDHGGRTPLMYAVLGNQPKMCELLIQLGADLSTTDYSSLSPLLWAAYHLRSHPMRVLLRHNADIGFCDSDGRSAFHWSCKAPDTKCLKLLCKFAKAGVANKADGEGLAALHWAVMCDNDAHIRVLLSSTDANASITDREGRTPLNYAALNYSPHCIKAILDNQDMAVNQIDPKGRTALHYSCAEGSADCVRALLSYKSCDINAQDNNGTTPIHWAAAANQSGVLQFLLRRGADRTMLDHEGMTALDHAQQRGYQKCVTILESYGLKRQFSVYSLASQASLPIQPPRPVDQHGHVIPKRPGRQFSLAPGSTTSSTSTLNRPPGDGHSHPDGAGDVRTPSAPLTQPSVATTSNAGSSIQHTVEASSGVAWQEVSHESFHESDSLSPQQSNSFFSRFLSMFSCGPCSRNNAIAPAEMTSQAN